jgi:glycosyltransferase involved in cell wall biosynthesis
MSLQEEDESALIEQVSNRPLVTFALFAYNQERFIREAIEGAFGQTYEPLEIILSDDCSTDNTFGMMREAAAAYHGPHRVRLNRTETNIGVFRHLLEVVAMAEGELMVLAAGDDISLPERAGVFVENWRKTGASAMCTSWHLMSESGTIMTYNNSPDSLDVPIARYLSRNDGLPPRSIQGSTSCYLKSFLQIARYPDYRIDGEDHILSFLANVLNLRVEYIDIATVLYRQNSQAAYNNGTAHKAWSLDVEARYKRRLASNVYCNTYLVEMYELFDKSNYFMNDANIILLRDEMRSINDMLDWDQKSLIERCIGMVSSIQDIGRTRWKAARLFGASPNYQPLKFLKQSLS